MNTNQLYLQPDEGKFLGMSVVTMLEHIKTSLNNQNIPWTPESRATLKDMIQAGEKLKLKLGKLGFDLRPLPDLEDGEELDYVTKES